MHAVSDDAAGCASASIALTWRDARGGKPRMAERIRKNQRSAPTPTALGGSFASAPDAKAIVTQGYLDASRRPLEVLFFLLPFIALYEYELVRVLRSPDGLVTNGAHLALLRLFDAFGLDAIALSLPGFLLVAIFLVQHVLSRGPWIVNLSVVARMYLESAALAAPLLVFAALLERMTPAAQIADFASLPLGARIAVSIGAGLYEELVFRMVLVGVASMALVELAGFKRQTAVVAAVALSGLAFALYHPILHADGSLDVIRVIFLFGGGLYFGILFVQRGFGIAAATHALFDIATAMMIPAPSAL
jgi:hypothetical protein